jgi:hypothetical protein
LRIREKFSGESDLLKLVCFLIFIAHFQACIWNLISENEIKSNYELTWLGNIEEVQSMSWDTKYLNSLYFSIVTMTTVGYGDVVPKTGSINKKNYKFFFFLYFK